MTVVGLLHPGSMGAAIGSQLRGRGVDVLWCPAGRSGMTAARADAAGLAPAVSLQALVANCSVLLSVCPPGVAEDVASQVARHSFAGVYVEANPIAPERVQGIATLLPQAVVVDGGIVGSPPAGGKTAWLYLAGPPVATVLVADLFVETAVQTRIVADRLGPASALKLSYSAFQKSSRVLAALAYAAADRHGVAGEMMEIAGRREGSYLADVDYLPKTMARAWRWGPEIEQAAELLEAVDVPVDVLRSVAAQLNRWADQRDTVISEAETVTSRLGSPRLQAP